DRARPRLAGDPRRGAEPGHGDGRLLGADPPDVRPPVPSGDGQATHRLRPRTTDRTGARAPRGWLVLDRRGRLPGRLRGSDVLPAPVPAHDRPDPSRVPAKVGPDHAAAVGRVGGARWPVGERLAAIRRLPTRPTAPTSGCCG